MTATASYTVLSPQWILTYSGVNITSDVSQMVLAIRYVDRLDGASGELEVELEDSMKLWQGPWYPALGDAVSLQIGYSGQPLLDCGDFQIDELELDGPPDVMRIRCLAAYITPAMRTANTIAYENMGIVEIAAQIAGKYGLTLVTASSESESDVVFARVTQRRQMDLEFLKRLAREHNFDFTVRAGQLVFYERPALECGSGRSNDYSIEYYSILISEPGASNLRRRGVLLLRSRHERTDYSVGARGPTFADRRYAQNRGALRKRAAGASEGRSVASSAQHGVRGRFD